MHSESFTPRNSSLQLERGVSDSLSMNQMSRRIIRHSTLNAAFRRAYACLNKKLRIVPDFKAEIFSAICKRRVISKQHRVFLHRCPAPGCINDDSVGARLEKNLDVFPCKLPRHFELSSVSMQRTATNLSIGT